MPTRMRTMTLLAGLMLATALVALAPAAEAGPGNCVGNVYVHYCFPDRCEYQSDCCTTTDLWCPEYEDS